MGLVVMFFSLPSLILLICLIAYTVSWLRTAETPVPRRGNVVFTMSQLIIILAVIIPLPYMHTGKWNRVVIELMMGASIPVIIVSVLTAVSSRGLMKRT